MIFYLMIVVVRTVIHVMVDVILAMIVKEQKWIRSIRAMIIVIPATVDLVKYVKLHVKKIVKLHVKKDVKIAMILLVIVVNWIA